jgi:hypothetical protein
MQVAVPVCSLRCVALALALGLLPSCSEPAYSDAGDAGGDVAMVSRDSSVPRVDAEAGARQDAEADPEQADAGEALIPLKDAGVPTERAPDGGQVELASSMPSWATPLLGRYAARSYAFSQDKAGSLNRAREYVLVDIVELEQGSANAHVELQLQLCDSFVEGTAGEIAVVSPLKTVRRDNRVLFGDHSWTTQAAAATDGYVRALPARCEGHAGTLVGKDPAQTWIAGAQCRCPSSFEAVPTLDDCRIVDSDDDGNPGATLHLHPKVLGLGDTDLYVATINQNTFVSGTVGSAGRHSAQLSVEQYGYQLDCKPAGCLDISESPAPCGPARNKAEFARLGDAGDTSFTCQDVLERASELFPTVLPGYPDKCP